jgi:hypothetical protein
MKSARRSLPGKPKRKRRTGANRKRTPQNPRMRIRRIAENTSLLVKSKKDGLAAVGEE